MQPRFLVGADALFAFDQATLTPDAEETLQAPNTRPDGTADPSRRQRNRLVEMMVNTP